MAETTQKLPEKREFLAIGLGLLVGMAILRFWYPHTNNFAAEDIALGEFTSSYYPYYQGFPIHGRSAWQAEEMQTGWEQRGKHPVCLFLANSQIHGINQYQPGQQNVPEILFKKFLREGFDFLTFSVPSVSLQENLLIFDYVQSRLKPRALVLPIVFINQRPYEIRDLVHSVLKDEGVRQDLEQFEIGREIIKRYPVKSEETAATPKVTEPIFADQVENQLNEWANQWIPYWKDRGQMRAFTAIHLIRLRNTVFFVDNLTQRGKNPRAYEANLEALRTILKLCQKSDIKVLLYIAPLRPAAELPYIPEDYLALKNTIKTLSQEYGTSFLDLDGIIEEKYWGYHLSDNFWKAVQPDFFHFQEPAHRILAEQLEQPVREMLQENR